MVAIASDMIAACDVQPPRWHFANTALPIPLTALLVSDDLLFLFPQTLHAERDHIAGLEVLWFGLHAHADTWRRPGRDHVARQQRHVFRHVRDQLGDAKNHRFGIAGLPACAVDVEPHVEILDILDLVGRHQPWPDGPERIATLALAPLRSA